MTTLGALEKRMRSFSARMGPPAAPMTAVEMAGALGLVLDDWQCTALQSTDRRLLLNIHRQGGKSLVMALLGLHAILSAPRTLVLTVSPTERQSALLFRQIMRFYRDLGSPVPALIENRLSLELANGSAVYALPGSEANIRGFSSVALMLADEAARIPDSLVAAMRPMLGVSDGRLIAASTPAGQRGWWWQAWTEGADDWRRFEVRAETCPRLSPAFLAAERRALPRLVYQAEYECAFVETADSVFSHADINAALVPDLAGIRLFTEEELHHVA